MNIREDIRKHGVEPDDIKTREAARLELERMGSAAVADLIHQLKTDTEPCRREAARILGEVQDTSAADDLVEALLDDSIGVEWAASEALVKYRRAAILPLLKGITRHFDSERFRRGAYHVLHALDLLHQLGPKGKEVLDALRGVGSSTSAAWASERAIEYLEFGAAS